MRIRHLVPGGAGIVTDDATAASWNVRVKIEVIRRIACRRGRSARAMVDRRKPRDGVQRVRRLKHVRFRTVRRVGQEAEGVAAMLARGEAARVDKEVPGDAGEVVVVVVDGPPTKGQRRAREVDRRVECGRLPGDSPIDNGVADARRRVPFAHDVVAGEVEGDGDIFVLVAGARPARVDANRRRVHYRPAPA